MTSPSPPSPVTAARVTNPLSRQRERGHCAGNPDEMIITCRSCGCPDLYLQKDFPRKIAIPIVIAGALAVPWTYGISLIVVALADFLLYRKVPWMTVCYRCHAIYRKFRLNPQHKEFDRHLDELYRY